jgi:hypothetical protein
VVDDGLRQLTLGGQDEQVRRVSQSVLGSTGAPRAGLVGPLPGLVSGHRGHNGGLRMKRDVPETCYL